MRRARVLLPVVLGAALVLGGCGGESSPKPAPYTRSASASPTPPATPAALNGTDEAAARALVEYYLDALTYASRTGDTSPLEPLGAPTCSSCQRVFEVNRQTYQNGGRLTGSGYSVEKFLSVKTTSDGYRIVARVRAETEKLYRTATSAPVVNPGGSTDVTYSISTRPTSLIIDGWGFDQ